MKDNRYMSDKVIEKLTSDTKKLFDLYDSMGLHKTLKQKSEDISGLLENAMAENLEGAVAPKIDAEPDIRIDGEAVEIKTTSGTSWSSGTFSKREGYFLFLHYALLKDNTPEFFIAGKNLKKDDWTPSKSKNYYATTYDKKKVYANREDWDFYKGHIEAYGPKMKFLKIHTEGYA